MGRAIVVIASSICLLFSSVRAEELARKFDFQIDQATLGEALTELSRQARVGSLYPYDLADSPSINSVAGRMTVVEALDGLLRDTDFSADLTESEVIVVSRRKQEPEGQMANGKIKTTLLAGVASLVYGVANAQDIELIEGDSREEQEKAEERDEVIVTGTNIRGIAPDSSPTMTFDRNDLDVSGAATLQDFLQTIPQNFGGGSNATVVGGLPNDFSASYNSGRAGTYGSSANLRGLGSGSTLVLLNSQRIAPASGLGNFVDISLIPASAIQRVEMLTDGAASIYGGDAVAGVVNYILRDDFEGVEATARYGTVTEGDLDEYRASVTLGENWNGGNALLSYEYFNRGNLSAADRSFSQNANLPNDLFASQERHSVLLSGSQELTPNLEFSADFLYGNRTGIRDTSGATYTFRILPDTSTLHASGALKWDVSADWSVDFSGAFSSTDGEIPTTGDSSWHTSLDSNLWTMDAKASGALFGIWGGDLQLALGGHYREESFSNTRIDIDTVQRAADRNVYAVYGELFAPLISEDNNIPGVNRLEISTSARFEDYSDFGTKLTPKVGVLWAPVEQLRLRASYGRSYSPPPLGRVGATDYSAFVASTAFINDAIGLTASDPSIADVTAIYISGTAPNLSAESSQTFSAGFNFDHEAGPHSFRVVGTYLDINYENRLGNTPIPGNRSVFDAPNIAFLDPGLFPPGIVNFSPTLDQITAIMAGVSQVVMYEDDVDALDAQIISSVQLTQNLSLNSVQTVDFDAGYQLESSAGDFSLGVSGSYLINYKQQASPTSAIVNRIDTLYNPTHLKLRGRAGYSSGGFNANVFLNYTNSYKFDNLPGSQTVDSYSTVDLSTSYAFGESSVASVLGNAKIRLSVSNLFDQQPPSTLDAPTFSLFGYDPTNASPLGRFISVELSTSF
ncbi:TonB-dependent receptor plug domain-containing protein [Hyphococcus lacteus]|uniref:TonB-dependent receptor n=1 Tax=Hyphococcus lacteus TaxID=3143536 RepID=A0ABV3Z7J7_9PROT